MTVPRLLVLGVIATHPHVDAGYVARTLRHRGLSRQTVYGNLDALVAAKLLRRVEPADSAALYELRIEGDDHHHLMCRHCRRLFDTAIVPGVDLTPTGSQAPGFRVDGVDVFFWGVCGDCAAERTRVDDPTRSDPASPARGLIGSDGGTRPS
ncbi:Fur family transcriptional regulator [Rhodococcoides corynebacterioides]|uniref:Fur family transcriptional regulator n=1 Tax=Rhodococcoides corynebacterioides TaxID=53972 RepID=UPI0027E0A60E|nr:Fur family transcriptional regulator [Rhodococcus corynebacterioides]